MMILLKQHPSNSTLESDKAGSDRSLLVSVLEEGCPQSAKEMMKRGYRVEIKDYNMINESNNSFNREYYRVNIVYSNLLEELQEEEEDEAQQLIVATTQHQAVQGGNDQNLQDNEERKKVVIKYKLLSF